jgi:hypothetical protein
VVLIAVAVSVLRVKRRILVGSSDVPIDVNVVIDVVQVVSCMREVVVDAAPVTRGALLTAWMHEQAEKNWAVSVHGGSEDDGAMDEGTRALGDTGTEKAWTEKGRTKEDKTEEEWCLLHLQRLLSFICKFTNRHAHKTTSGAQQLRSDLIHRHSAHYLAHPKRVNLYIDVARLMR